jgi:hypothetical protein
MPVLKTSVVVSLIIVTVTAVGFGGSATHTGAKHKGYSTSSSDPKWLTGPFVQYGVIKSLTKRGSGYKLRLDLHELFGDDKTGAAACVDNHECPPGTTSFLDDTYDHDFKYVLTYYVPRDASVQLLAYPRPDVIVTARYFYELAHGKNPLHLQIEAPLGPEMLSEFGFSIHISLSEPERYRGLEHVTGLLQIYHP